MNEQNMHHYCDKCSLEHELFYVLCNNGVTRMAYICWSPKRHQVWVPVRSGLPLKNTLAKNFNSEKWIKNRRHSRTR